MATTSGNNSRAKVIIHLHEGAVSTTKLWRFDADCLKEYTLDGLKCEILSLFPHLQKKKLSVNVWHVDDLVGKVSYTLVLASTYYSVSFYTIMMKVDVDSDAAVHECLQSFSDEHNGRQRREHLTLHAEDCLIPSPSAPAAPVRVGQKVAI